MPEARPREGLKELFSAEQIRGEVERVAEEIDMLYGDEPLVVLCVLKGAYAFFSDLVRHLKNMNVELDFLRLSSYGNRSESSGSVTLVKDIDVDIAGRHVLVVEDVVDTGNSLHFLLRHLRQLGARSVRIAAVIDKMERREVDVRVDFSCFNLDHGFIVGYGMDYSERYRTLPGINELLFSDRERPGRF